MNFGIDNEPVAEPDGSDPGEGIAGSIVEAVRSRGGRATLREIEAWAEPRGIGRYTLRTLVGDLIEGGLLLAPEGFDNGEDEPPSPRVLEVPPIEEDLARMKAYLREYWSVGLLRIFDDLGRSGMCNIGEVLKAAIGEGCAELLPTGVVNATEKLLRGGRAQGTGADPGCGRGMKR